MPQPRYKPDSIGQHVLLSVDFKAQIQHGSIEWAIQHIVNHELNLDALHARYQNGFKGAPAFDPAILLKIVLYAYSRGILHSRPMARACCENITFMALSGESKPSYRTLSGFIASMGDVIGPLFTDVLMYCDELGLIHGEMFAVDGCKLPSNASKEHSGTHKRLKKRRARYQRQVDQLLEAHKQVDALEENPVDAAAAEQKTRQKITEVKAKIKKVDAFLAKQQPRKGARGKEVQSNLTDNESAKMQTGHGCLQGYNGIAAADSISQVVVHAEVNGAGPENDQLIPALEGIDQQLKALGKAGLTPETAITADSGFHSDQTMTELETMGINGYIADTGMRDRDPLFDDRDEHKTEHRKARRKQRLKEQDRQKEPFSADQFIYDPTTGDCQCPAGQKMKPNGKPTEPDGRLMAAFRGDPKQCLACPLRADCLKKPSQTSPRQVRIVIGQSEPVPKEPTASQRMKDKIDSVEGKRIYSRRIATIEPVFGNHRNHGRERFTLRTKAKVNAQWKLYNLVHNIGKAQVSGRMTSKRMAA